MKVKMVILSKILKIQNKKTFEQVKMIKIEIKVNLKYQNFKKFLGILKFQFFSVHFNVVICIIE